MGIVYYFTLYFESGWQNAQNWVGLQPPFPLKLTFWVRNRVMLQTDGQVRTGRDVVIAAMLGAEAL